MMQSCLPGTLAAQEGLRRRPPFRISLGFKQLARSLHEPGVGWPEPAAAMLAAMAVIRIGLDQENLR
jgi:hypothetical protein